MSNNTDKFPFSAALSRYSEVQKWMSSAVSHQSWYALDCLNFLVASVQIGLWTFVVAYYLASLGWSKENVGLALASGQIAGVLGQIPGGAITDAVTWKRGFAALGILMSMGAALIFAAAPQFALVLVAEIIDGLTAAIVPLAITAISLGLVGRRAMSSRTGRNYRFAATASYLRPLPKAPRQLFRKERDFLCHRRFVRSCSLALSFIKPDEIDYCRARNAVPGEAGKLQTLRTLVGNRALLCLGLCLVLLQFADASVVPLLSENIGMSKTETSSLQITGLILTAQLVVMLLAPWIGYLSEGYGRTPLLIWGFGLESIRSMLLSTTTNYSFLLVGQFLGGMTNAIVGVLTIVIITDLTARTGRFNLASGAVTMLMGTASSLSVATSGFIFRLAGHSLAFVIFAAFAGVTTILAWLLLPETKPASYAD